VLNLEQLNLEQLNLEQLNLEQLNLEQLPLGLLAFVFGPPPPPLNLVSDVRLNIRERSSMNVMMASATNLWVKLGKFRIDGMVGTGPSGASGGKRWISLHDVIRHAYEFERLISPKKEWERDMDDEVERTPLYKRREDIEMWEHQISAICKCMPATATFKSGIIDMDCGTGKSFVGAELIRRSRAPAIVVTQHTFSVNQWTTHLTNFGLKNVMTLKDVRRWSPLRDSFPDALVVTYSALARSLGEMDQKRTSVGSEEVDYIILWMARVAPFGLLVLDEVHMAAADHFGLACSLYSRTIIGLSGSLIREDDRLSLLKVNVGPVLYRHRAQRFVTYTLVRVPVPDVVTRVLSKCKRREKDEHAVRTLNPHKLGALKNVVCDETLHDNRLVIFCDSAEAAPYLVDFLQGMDSRICVGIMDGKTKQCTRDERVRRFRDIPRSTIVSTKVCDVAIDFPKDCTVVILHSSSGSRQQEVQRCGRGTRGDVTSARIFHIVNEDTEEEGFVKRRLKHMSELYEGGFTLHERYFAEAEQDSSLLEQFLSQLSTPVVVNEYEKKGRQITKRAHNLKKAVRNSWKQKKTLPPTEPN
jgi:superfamily II DNA or RNA helicase